MGNIEETRRYFKAWSDHDADAVLATFIEGGTYQDCMTGGPVAGDAMRGYCNVCWTAFPDLVFEIESIGEMGPNLVAVQWIGRGTFKGDLMGLPPTGKTVALHGADFVVHKDVKIQSVTGYFDSADWFRQAGVNVIVQPF